MMIEKTINNDFKEKFISYEQMNKGKKKRTNEEDTSHLNEYFSKVKDKEKKVINELV